MKAIVVENNSRENPKAIKGWYNIADSALANSGKPFFIPDENSIVEVALAPAIRFSRLGKSIEPKFAPRYYSEYAPALHFILPELREELLSRGLSPDRALSFDRSLIVGEFMPFPEDSEDFSLQLLINREPASVWSPSDILADIPEIIKEISASNTIKMGDILLPSLSAFVRIKIGDYLEVRHGSDTLLTVKVK